MSIFKNGASAEFPADAPFFRSISDLIDRHNTDAVLLAEAVVFFRKWLVGYDGVQLFHGRIGHKRDPAEFGMICKKDHAVGILCNGFLVMYSSALALVSPLFMVTPVQAIKAMEML